MATDFWVSTHFKKWLVDRQAIASARSEDLRFVDPETLAYIDLFFANLLSKLGKKLGFHQRVIATATIFFKRFYLKNAYSETEPFIVAAACCYVAGKAEESPVHIKTVLNDAKAMFAEYGINVFTADTNRLAEMEFYLVADLECDLVVFHPYRTLTTLCGKQTTGGSGKGTYEAGELGSQEEGEAGAFANRETSQQPYSGTGAGKLLLDEKTLQLAWLIINDTYRTDICLLYPPFIIAVAAIYMALVNSEIIENPPQETPPTVTPQRPPILGGTALHQFRSARQKGKGKKVAEALGPDAITFLANLNVSMSQVASITQDMISMYSLWDRYVDDPGQTKPATVGGNGSPGQRSGKSGSNGSSPHDVNNEDLGLEWKRNGGEVRAKAIAIQILRLRDERDRETGASISGSASRVPVNVVNKRLERAMAAG